MKRTGKVILVGAGPGDPGLLTIKGREHLQRADVVVYDRLLSSAMMDCIPAKAKRINVGKEMGHHPIPQNEINEILAREAKKGSLVVRLKGGDPFVFGRGAEELELLRDEGIPFEVVPGVTSAVAALAYAGIPITHRSHASSLHIITGHAKADGELNIDYDALVKAGGTLVFLMGVSSLHLITDGLLAAGMAADIPAAMVENGTLPYQRKVIGKLGDILHRAKAERITSPAILTVGGVCGCEGMDWFGQLPLRGKTVVVTRPQSRAGMLCERLGQLGANTVAFPCIHTEDQPDGDILHAINNLGQYEWLALTSPQGVDTMFSMMGNHGLDARTLAGVKIAAIGSATAGALAVHGIRADYVPEQYDALHLGSGLAQRAKGRVLLLRALEGTKELTDILMENGLAYDDIAIYRTIHRCDKDEKVQAMLEEGEVDYITFTSMSTVQAFNECLPDAASYPFTALCIGPSTLAAAQKLGYKVLMAESATIEAMVDKIVEDAK